VSGDCPFCARIEAGEYDAGDGWSVTFEPLNPVAPGHRLFVSRAHVADALTRPVITGHVMEYAGRWAAGHDLRPCNLISSAGAAASQTVPHLHIHLVPRAAGDGLMLPWTGQKHAAEPATKEREA
jgi:histidine triad (HIT) family protein